MKEKRPKLKVFRSSKHIYCQVVDNGKVLAAASDFEIEKDANLKKMMEKIEGTKKVKEAFLVGILIAKKCKERKIEKIAFDRGGYKYHGRIKALAEGARKGGLIF